MVILISEILIPTICRPMERVDFPAAWAAINGGVNMIKLKHIYKSYSLGDEQVDVLHDINLHVKPKEFVSILRAIRQW